MTRKRADLDPSLAKALDTVEFNPDRSPLFWYLYANHDDLLRKAKGSRIKWTHVCVDLEPLGLLDGKGKPPTPQRASRTFANVRELKDREQAVRYKRQRARARGPERGMDADRPPPVVTAPTPLPPVPQYPPPPIMPPLQNAMHSRPNAPPIASGRTQTPEEMRADIKAIIKKRSQYF